MKKLTAVYFACSRDLDLLEWSAAQFPRDIQVVAAFDEGDDVPESIAGIEKIIRTKFPRGISLNQTPDCITGMLGVYHQLVIDEDCATLLKIDCDTALTGDLTAIPFEEFDLIGQQGEIEAEHLGELVNSYRFAKGAAYALSATIIRRMASYDVEELLAAVNAFSGGLLDSMPSVKWAEDETFSLLARMLQPDANRIRMIPDGDGFRNFVSDYDYSLNSASPGIFTNYGNLYGTSKDEGRQRVLAAMKGEAID